MLILIRWLHQKPADLDLQCFQKRINLGFSRTRNKLNGLSHSYQWVKKFPNLELLACIHMIIIFYSTFKRTTFCYLKNLDPDQIPWFCIVFICSIKGYMACMGLCVQIIVMVKNVTIIQGDFDREVMICFCTKF